MRAYWCDQPTQAMELAWQEVPEPTISPDQVVIEVASTAVNRADILQRKGFYPPPPGTPHILGLECAGTVIEVGSAVTRWTVGQEVCALLPGGGYAERVGVDEHCVAPLPPGIPAERAGGHMEVCATVWSNVLDVGQLRAGQWCLIHGGSGGVGSTAIQVAKAIGAQVITTAGSDDRARWCQDLGADVAINYREADFVEQVRAATSGEGVSLILDNMGAKYLSGNVSALARGGRLVVIGLQGGVTGECPLGTLLQRQGSIVATSLRHSSNDRKAEVVTGVVRDIWPMIAAGDVTVAIDRVVSFDEVGAAHALLESSEQLGKVLICV